MQANGLRAITNEDFLRRFPSAVEQGRLALRWLEEAYKARSAEDLQYALIVGFGFGFGPEHLDILCRLVEVDWLYSHEDVVSALDGLRTHHAGLRTHDVVEALFRATQWIPKSLEYDDFRALAVKAIWALGNIPGPEAEAKLETLARSDHAILRKNAVKQLGLRHQAP
ncbi:MAG: HEAT repeat domain-containing protein [Acidiferrobacteraceae bacterium]